MPNLSKSVLFCFVLLANITKSRILFTSELLKKKCDLSIEKHLTTVPLSNTLHNTTYSYNLSLFVRFDSFADLYTTTSNCKYPVSRSVSMLPNQMVLLEANLDFAKIFTSLQMQRMETLTLLNIQGIDRSLATIFRTRTQTLLSLHYSALSIYSNNTLISEQDCTSSSYPGVNRFFRDVFTFYAIKTKFAHPVCPLMFRGSFLNSIYIADITNSFMSKNRLRFVELSDEVMQMNFLLMLKLDVIYEGLTKEILNRNLFRQIYVLNVYGIVNEIQQDVFREFGLLKNVDLVLSNFRQLFHLGNKWMTSLNSRVHVNLSNRSEVKLKIAKFMRLRLRYEKKYVSFDRVYEYPDEDLCLFREFPHQQLVYPVLVPGRVIKCTCTIKGLRFYAHLYSSAIKETTEYSLNDKSGFLYDLNATYAFCDESFNMTACQFEQRFQKCDLSILKTNTGFRLDNDINV